MSTTTTQDRRDEAVDARMAAIESALERRHVAMQNRARRIREARQRLSKPHLSAAELDEAMRLADQDEEGRSS